MSVVNVDDKFAAWGKPARKVFLNQLKLLSKSESSDEIIVQVWIQGIIVAKGIERIIMEDATGRVTVTNFNNVPQGSEWVEKGMYITVIGTINDTNLPIVEAQQIKPCPIQDTNYAKELWNMEVKDFWNFLASTIKS